ncbi:hypothetical protein HYV71_02975 [Candidatus Uhrbacteria bacterium]|nr:hypothetical protein [Candidatus Uhrbacteria bacterium]
MTVLHSFYYALLGSIPSILIGATSLLMILGIGIVSPDSFRISSVEYLGQTKFYYPLLKFFSRYYYLIAAAAGLIYVFLFFILFRLLNPNFSGYYFKVNSISQWKVAFWLLMSMLVAGIASYLAAFIHPLAGMFPGTFLMWLLWHRYGLWGSLLAFSKEKEKRVSLFRPTRLPEERHLLAVGIRAAINTIFIMVMVGLTIMTVKLVYFAISNTYLESVLSIKTGKDIFLLGIAAYALIGSVSLPLVYALSDVKASWQQHSARLIVPFLILTAAGVLPLYAQAFLEEHDYLRSISAATGIDASVRASQRVAVFEPSRVVYEYPINASMENLSNAYDVSLEDLLLDRDKHETEPTPSVACTSNTIKKLTDWIFLGKSSSSLTAPLFFLLQDCYAMTWDMNQLIRARYQNFTVTNSLVSGLRLVSRRFASAQENPLHIRYLQILQNDPFTYISDDSNQRIQQVLDHYSQASKTRGYISGRVFSEHVPANRATVGLLMDKIPKDEAKEGEYQYGHYLGEPIEKYLVASTKTDRYGRFFFPALREGTYILALIIPDAIIGSAEDIRPLTTQEIQDIAIDGELVSRNLGSIAIFSKDTLPQDRIIRYVMGADADGDGLSDEEEAYYGTDPKLSDTDKDGFSDYNELNSGYDPLRPKVRYYPK